MSNIGTISLDKIPNEILKVYSREAQLKALPLFVFGKFVEKKIQLGLEPGKTISFLKYNDVGNGKWLDEFTPVPRQSMSSSTVELSVKELANSIQLTRMASTTSYRDLLSDISTLLARSYSRTIDEYLRDIFLSTANIQWAGGNTADNQVGAANVFNTNEIKDSVEVLKTLNVPPVYRGNSNHYICIAHPHQLRTLRDDNNWIRAREYVDPSDMYNGEVGRYENVVFIETTQMPKHVGLGQGGIDLYSAVMFGDRAVGYAETVPLEMVSDGAKDHGRFYSIGYYTVCGAGIVNDFIIEMRTA